MKKVSRHSIRNNYKRPSLLWIEEAFGRLYSFLFKILYVMDMYNQVMSCKIHLVDRSIGIVLGFHSGKHNCVVTVLHKQ